MRFSIEVGFVSPESGWSRLIRFCVTLIGDARMLWVEDLVAKDFEACMEHKLRAIEQVAPPQLPGLLQKTISPFETGLTNPFRAPGHRAGHECKGCANADRDRNLKAMQAFVNPDVLLGHAQPHPQHVGLCCIDLLDDRVIFFPGERAKRRGESSGNLVLRILRTESSPEGSQR